MQEQQGRFQLQVKAVGEEFLRVRPRGLGLDDPALGVDGHDVGVLADGATAQANVGNGVSLDSRAGGSVTGNTVGGTAAGAANVISGNSGSGVFLGGANTSANLVQGNLVGTDSTATIAVGNTFGVTIANGANNNTIGGTDPTAANVGLISCGLELRS